jgi:NhaP-type Na+/H+ or K+/H+ antiporter
VGAAIALGAALAPTDPVLAGDLGVAPPEEEEREREPEPEFVLTSEAGFNDGLALPFLLLGIAVAADRSLWRWAGVDLAYGVGVALVLGALLGRAIAVGASHLREREWLSGDFDRWVGLASAFLVFGAAEAVGALGFVAVFVAGIAFRRHELSHEYRRDVHDGADVLKHFGELAVILVLGSMLAVDGFSGAGGWGLALAPAAVFVIRPLVALATLVRSRLALRERIWVAWFGVKGIATLNYVSIAAGSSDLAGERRQLVWIVLPTIALSILVHGITASPLSAWLLRPDRRDGPRLQLLPHPGLVGQLLDLRRKLVAHHDPPAPPT